MKHLIRALALVAPLCLSMSMSGAEGARPRAAQGGQKQIPLDPVGDFVIPLVYDGGGYGTSFFATNRDSKVIHAGFYFYNSDGAPIRLPISGVGVTSAVVADIDVNQSLTFQTTGQASTLAEAYVEVLTFDRPASDPSALITSDLLSSQAILSKNVNGIIIDAPEPISSGFETTSALQFNNLPGYATGLTIVNADPNNSTTVTLTLRDNGGNQLQKDVFSIAGGAKASIVIPQAYPSTAGQQGRIFVSGSGSYLSVIGVRANSTGAFTTLLPFSLDNRLLP